MRLTETAHSAPVLKGKRREAEPLSCATVLLSMANLLASGRLQLIHVGKGRGCMWAESGCAMGLCTLMQSNFFLRGDGDDNDGCDKITTTCSNLISVIPMTMFITIKMLIAKVYLSSDSLQFF